MTSPKKILSWVKAQDKCWAIFVMKAFLPYFFYIAAQKIYRRLISMTCDTKEQNQKSENKKEMLSLSSFYEFPSVPHSHDNRRIVMAGWRKDIKHIVQCLRDNFPEEPRLKFGWGNFQPNSFNSLKRFSEMHKKKSVYISTESPLFGISFFINIKNLENSKMEKLIHFRVALHDSSTLNNGYFALPAKANSQRFENILNQTNSVLKPYRKTGTHILYPLQMPHETNSPGINPFEAAQYDLINLRRYTSRPIVITVKPSMIRDKISEEWAKQKNPTENQIIYYFLKNLCKKLNVKIFDTRQTMGKNSYSFLRDCWCVVCQSGTFSVDALMAGVPVLTSNPSNFMYPICSHNISEIENPKTVDRIPWFSRLAYCQWTLSEIKNGDVWRHFQPSIEKLLNNR